MSSEHKAKGAGHWSSGLLWIRKLGRDDMCTPCRLFTLPVPAEHAPTRRSLWLMGAACAHWRRTRAPEHYGSRQVGLVYFQVWTGWSLKTEPDLVSYLNSAPLPPRPWQSFRAQRACLFLVGHAGLSLIRGPEDFGRLRCVSISQLMEAMCLQNGKNPASSGSRHVLP